MPDVFVAPEEKRKVIMHQRIPLPTQAEESAKKVLEEEKEIPSPTPPRKQTVLLATQPEKPQIAENNDNGKKSVTIPSFEPPTTKGGIPLFASFWQNPRGVYFDTQEANEHILLFLRQHFITNIPWMFFTLIFLILPPIAFAVIDFAHVSISFLPPAFIAAGTAFYYLIVVTHAFTHFLEWYFNISLITPRRVLDIEQKDLVYKKISATKMALVQDITYQQSGTIRTIFNYGDVMIQTAGATDNFYINACPKPETVVKIVEQLIGKKSAEEKNAGI